MPERVNGSNQLFGWSGRQAVLFDLDGVLTPTAALHRQAWRQLFAEFFTAGAIHPAYSEQDYFDHIDGKPRQQGVRDLLASRGIELPLGRPDQPGELPLGQPTAAWPADSPTVSSLSQRKNQLFNQLLAAGQLAAYPDGLRLLVTLQQAGWPMALVSSSRNAQAVLQAAGLTDFFSVIVDGIAATELGLAGKPDPATFAAAAAQLSVSPAQAVVIEDALAGVQAGQAGGFGWVIGVDRGAGRTALQQAGADTVVSDLTELLPIVE